MLFLLLLLIFLPSYHAYTCSFTSTVTNSSYTFNHRIEIPFDLIDHYQFDRSYLTSHVYLNIILINTDIITITYPSVVSMLLDLSRYKDQRHLYYIGNKDTSEQQPPILLADLLL